MTPEDQKSEAIRRYRDVLSLHERTLKYLQSVELDPELLQTYKAVLHFLRTRTDEQIFAILGTNPKHRGQKRDIAQDELADDVIERLTLDQVREQVTTDSASRRLLERIAAVRFGMTRGAMSNLKSRNALIEKIMTLISNEGAHGAIARAVESGRR